MNATTGRDADDAADALQNPANEPRNDAERRALAAGRDFLERTLWAVYVGHRRIYAGDGVVLFQIRGRGALDGKAARVEVGLGRDGAVDGPRELKRNEKKSTPRVITQARKAGASRFGGQGR